MRFALLPWLSYPSCNRLSFYNSRLQQQQLLLLLFTLMQWRL